MSTSEIAHLWLDRLGHLGGGIRARAALGAALALLCGCGSPPDVAVPADADSPVCAKAPWPPRIDDLSRVATQPQSPAIAAWGSPPIIARCGLPPLTPTTDDCVTVNGVDWIIRPLSDGSSATTYGRDPAIEVLAPTDYGAVTMLLPLFADVAKTLPASGRHCV